jgi:hypothetical protein
MIRKFVLYWIRTHMSHETPSARTDIFRAINEGCAAAFTEDNLQTRISWTVGELVRADREFYDRCSGADNAELRLYVARATELEISKFR